jgi:lipopolysaccharide export LptBFGC system permease protein LptF
METHNIDSIFRKAVEQSADFYDAEAEKSKERIWRQIQPNRKIITMPLLIRSLAAACILFILCTTAVSVSLIKARKTIQTLAEANHSLKNDIEVHGKTTVAKQTPEQQSIIPSRDTLYIEKEVIVYQQVVEKERVVDTVFVRQLVYVEKTQNQESAVAVKSSAEADSGYQNTMLVQEKEIMISNNESLKQEKRKRFQIRFGGEKNQEDNVPLAFTVKL